MKAKKKASRNISEEKFRVGLIHPSIIHEGAPKAEAGPTYWTIEYGYGWLGALVRDLTCQVAPVKSKRRMIQGVGSKLAIVLSEVPDQRLMQAAAAAAAPQLGTYTSATRAQARIRFVGYVSNFTLPMVAELLKGEVLLALREDPSLSLEDIVIAISGECCTNCKLDLNEVCALTRDEAFTFLKFESESEAKATDPSDEDDEDHRAD